MSSSKDKSKVSNRVRRRLQKQQRKQELKATQPQNQYQHHQVPQPEEPVIPKVGRVALGVRAVLVDQRRRRLAEDMAKEAQRQRRMKESQ